MKLNDNIVEYIKRQSVLAANFHDPHQDRFLSINVRRVYAGCVLLSSTFSHCSLKYI